ncbi:MAG: phosphoglucosamine mutase [Actinomycetota bacterium]|nr:phosphoglucosamine mutase [Actinomycetota bacterium]
MGLRFGTDGIRGVANAELTPELALALGRAAARHLPAREFLVGRDTRRSGPMLQAALGAGLASEGSCVVDLGVVPTPGLAWAAADRGAPGAMISASHNSFEDNGIKLLSATGSKLPDSLELEIEAELDAILLGVRGRSVGSPAGAGVGEIVASHELVDAYVDHLVASVELSGPRLRVVCDCANGSAGPIAPRVLERAGVDAVVVSASPDGTNINARCGSTFASLLSERVVAEGADVGLCFDGDADRLIALDRSGAVVDGDQLLAMFAVDLEDRGELVNDALVVTVMSNLGLKRSLGLRGISVVETPIGDRYVTDALEREGLVLGGEQSGHVVFRREATTGDGLLTALKLLELVSRRGRPLDELASEAMTRLPQELRNVRVPEPGRLGSASAVWAEVTAVEQVLGDTGRVLLRASGTEAAVRVMVEAESHEHARSAAERLVAAVRRELGSS